MISLRITHTKDFMQKLLSSEAFDSFLLEEATIQTYNTFSIDGHIQKEFYAGEETEIPALDYGFSLWKDMKAVCFQFIKGKRTPLSFRFVLRLMPQYAEKIVNSQDTSLLLNIRYDGSAVTLITGTSYRTFQLTKEPEQLWDKTVRTFLTKKEIAYEEGG